MILKQLYINEQQDYVQSVTGLSLDELESIVGRYRPYSIRASQLRGELVICLDNTVRIRHAFTKKVLWTGELYE
jgi:hypothetical protein